MSYLINYNGKQVYASIVSIENDMKIINKGDNKYNIEYMDNFEFNAEFVDKDKNIVYITMNFGKNYPFTAPVTTTMVNKDGVCLTESSLISDGITGKISKQALSEFSYMVDGKMKNW